MTSEGQHKRPAADQAQSLTSGMRSRIGWWLPQSANCFRCGSSELQRSTRRNWFEHAIGLVLLPYRCQRCDLRLFKSRWLKIQAK
jgi:hypothetical protein